MTRSGSLLLAVLALGLATAVPARAQYFGRNKVNYETFDWKVMLTPHYRIHYYPAEADEVTDAARMAERWNARLSRVFQHSLSDVKPLIFYANHPDFQQTNLSSEPLTENTGGFTEPIRDRLVLPFSGIYHDDDHVIGHEMVHVFQFDIASSGVGGGLQGFARLPSWMQEGLAEYLSKGRVDPLTAMWMRDAALTGTLPTVAQLNSDDPRFFPYRYGEALWAYIGGKWGDRAVAEIFRYALREGPEAAIRRVLGVSSDQLSHDWLAAVRAAYLPLIVGRTAPMEAGKLLIGKNELADMNLGPVVSPDGKYVAFYSQRGLFSIDLYVADAETGKIVKQLTSPLNNPHYDALSFFYSAGSWSPDAKKFAFTVFAQGDNELAILDVASGHVEREVSVKGVGSVTSPSWSPDGTKIAFSGQRGSLTDLFVLDVATGQTTQLTNDKYGDMQPTWSPDGSTIAWATDRVPETNFAQLTYGPMRIALMNLATGAVRVLPGLEGSKHINPQYSPDGKSLYFISDANGFDDIFRQDLATDQVYQVTNIATGVSGISDLSPAMSVARQNGRMLFSVYNNGGFNIHVLEAAETQGTPVTNAQAAESGTTIAEATVLPPVEALQTSIVFQYLRDPAFGLPADTVRYAVTEYSPKLSLEYLGQPTIGAGTSSFGTVIGGGASAYFTDLLNNHLLGGVIQANGELKDIGGQVFYQNATHRWNWMAGVSHIPYLSAFQFPSVGDTTNEGIPSAFTINQLLQRIFIDQAVATVAYPFSVTRRVEFSAGYTHYGFDYEVRQFFADAGGGIFAEERHNLPAPSGVGEFSATAAYVGDYSYFGFTSPVAGGRYRLEVTPSFGTLQYENVLADYRRYIFKNPVTFAFRAMHYGRYGAGAADSILTPLYLGYPTLVRGYSIDSFEPQECGNQNQIECPAIDRLLGSRIAVANLELRIPLFGVPQYGLINFPFLPTEIAPFLDAGLAWGKLEQFPSTTGSPVLKFARNTDERVPVFSAGLSARFNVLGFLVVEAYYAYPFQRPDKGWDLGFDVSPGW